MANNENLKPFDSNQSREEAKKNGRKGGIKSGEVRRARKTLREERREIKNNIEMIEVIKKFTDKYNNKLIAGDIIQNLKEQGILRKRQENPTYKYRTSILERLEAKDE